MKVKRIDKVFSTISQIINKIEKGERISDTIEYKGVKIRVSPIKPLTNSERVKAYINRNHEQVKKDRKIAYNKRRKKGLCVKCEAVAGKIDGKPGAMCKKCRAYSNKKQMGYRKSGVSVQKQKS